MRWLVPMPSHEGGVTLLWGFLFSLTIDVFCPFNAMFAITYCDKAYGPFGGYRHHY